MSNICVKNYHSKTCHLDIHTDASDELHYMAKAVGTKLSNKKSQSNLGNAISPPLMVENNYATKSQ